MIWNGHNTQLDEIAKHHLSRRLVVLLADLSDTIIHQRWLWIACWVLEIFVRPCQRRISDDEDVAFFTELRQLLLIQGRRALDLIHDRLDATVVEHTLNLFRIEVAHTNRFNKTKIDKRLHRFPSVQIVDIGEAKLAFSVFREQILRLTMLIADWRMHQELIDVVEAKILQRFPARRLNMLWIVKNVPQLGDNVDFLAFELARCDLLVDGFADLNFILVEVCGVDMTIAGLEGRLGRCVAVHLGALIRRRFDLDKKLKFRKFCVILLKFDLNYKFAVDSTHQISAETKDRHVSAIVEFNSWNR